MLYSPSKTHLVSDYEYWARKSKEPSILIYCKMMCAHRRQMARVTFFGFVFIISSDFLYTVCWLIPNAVNEYQETELWDNRWRWELQLGVFLVFWIGQMQWRCQPFSMSCVEAYKHCLQVFRLFYFMYTYAYICDVCIKLDFEILCDI